MLLCFARRNSHFVVAEISVNIWPLKAAVLFSNSNSFQKLQMKFFIENLTTTEIICRAL